MVTSKPQHRTKVTFHGRWHLDGARRVEGNLKNRRKNGLKRDVNINKTLKKQSTKRFSKIVAPPARFLHPPEVLSKC